MRAREKARGNTNGLSQIPSSSCEATSIIMLNILSLYEGSAAEKIKYIYKKKKKSKKEKKKKKQKRLILDYCSLEALDTIVSMVLTSGTSIKKRNKNRNIWLWLVGCFLLPTCYFHWPFTHSTSQSMIQNKLPQSSRCPCPRCLRRSPPGRKFCSSCWRPTRHWGRQRSASVCQRPSPSRFQPSWSWRPLYRKDIATFRLPVPNKLLLIVISRKWLLWTLYISIIKEEVSPHSSGAVWVEVAVLGCPS